MKLVHLLAQGTIVGTKRSLTARCGEKLTLPLNEPLTNAPVTAWGCDVTCTACVP